MLVTNKQTKYVYQVDFKNFKIYTWEYIATIKEKWIKCKSISSGAVWDDVILGEEIFESFKEAKCHLVYYIDAKINDKVNELIYWKDKLRELAKLGE